MTARSGDHFDYIIAGAGAAGLSLLVRMIKAGVTARKKVLLVDKAPKKTNDRTWCFWEKEAGLFEPVVFYSWQHMAFRSRRFSKDFSMSPYRYKMIRGIDFYRYCFEMISNEPNVTVRFGNVSDMYGNNDVAGLLLDDQKVTADMIYNSIIFSPDYLLTDQHHLLQHFKGWNIETAEPVFDPGRATLMDFRVPQPKGAAFVYVMPFSTHTALVEYTLFSKKLLAQPDYDNGLKSYIREHITAVRYHVKAEEFGVIPMTRHRFTAPHQRILPIGTAGGQTKGSSGYTFQFIQRATEALVQGMVADNKITHKDTPAKYRFYDNVLLNVLASRKRAGDEIFTQMFEKNSPENILRFLDNDSSLMQELRIIRSLPTWPFLRAAFEELSAPTRRIR